MGALDLAIFNTLLKEAKKQTDLLAQIERNTRASAELAQSTTPTFHFADRDN